MPAHLELVETPAHPAARVLQWVIVALVAVVLAVAVLGRLDIVATAKGRLVPDARVKQIQPAITGVVRLIAIRDGQRVKAGDLLMELDARQASADANKAQSARLDSLLAASRARALLAAERDGRSPRVQAVAGASADRLADAQRLAEGTYREFADQLGGARAELRKREAELASTRVQIAKLEATAPLARQQADDLAKLVKDAFVARHDFLNKQRIALELEHELAVQRSQAQELQAGISQQQAAIASLGSQFRRQQLDAVNRANEQAAQLNNDEAKATTRQELMSLHAPVDGTVQQLNVHTLGGVVTTAQTLMEIVPDDALEVEAQIENKDIGFVNVGQRAVVKLDAFPYTRYGYLSGEVISLSSDAVRDRRLGLVFVARVRLDANRIRANDKWIDLMPGMAATVEILTGQRSVARYFLDPLLETTQQSLRER